MSLLAVFLHQTLLTVCRSALYFARACFFCHQGKRLMTIVSADSLHPVGAGTYTFCPLFAASMRLCMGSRRGFICRMKVGNIAADNMAVGHLNRLKQRNSLGPSRDGQNYAVVHCTGYIKNWPPSGKVMIAV